MRQEVVKWTATAVIAVVSLAILAYGVTQLAKVIWH